MKMRNPVPDRPVNSRWGKRTPIEIAPGVTTLDFHWGDDRAAPVGTPIVASLPGKVIRTGQDNNPNYELLGLPRWPGLKRGYLYGGGYWVFIQTGDITVRYMHLSRHTHLKVGDWVNAGDRIGYVGATGVATGPHLHQEVLADGWWIDPQSDLSKYFPKEEDPINNVEEEDDEMKPTVHVRQDSKGAFSEGTRCHPEIGKELEPGQSRKAGKVTVYRGWEASGDISVVTAWARTHARGLGVGNVTSWTDRAGYMAIQEQATRLSIEFFGKAGK